MNTPITQPANVSTGPEHAEAAERVRNMKYPDAKDSCDLGRAYALELDTELADEVWLWETCKSHQDFAGNAIDYDMGGDVTVRFFMDNDVICRTSPWHMLGETRTRNPTRGLVRTLQRIGGGT